MYINGAFNKAKLDDFTIRDSCSLSPLTPYPNPKPEFLCDFSLTSVSKVSRLSVQTHHSHCAI